MKLFKIEFTVLVDEKEFYSEAFIEGYIEALISPKSLKLNPSTPSVRELI